jgi:signal transduction histidine kinase
MEQFQRELIAAFSHELRTPLASINTVVQLLLEQDDFGKDELSREHLELLRAQSRRLATFAERTLDVSRLERGQWDLEQRPVPFPLTLHNAVQRWQSIAARHPIQAAAASGGSLWAWADEEAVDTVLDNLIENAAKYSPDGARIVLNAVEGPAGFITVSVSDEGIGVDPEIRERIFDRFYRADASDTQRVYGHGLGLYIVRRIVEAMGGSVWVESTGGQGSRFAFTLHQMSRESHADPNH